MELGCSSVGKRGVRHGWMINYIGMGHERDLNHPRVCKAAGSCTYKRHMHEYRHTCTMQGHTHK